MRIAVIGWGSLIWNPGELALASRWRSDGPHLPLEFARVSRNGRLTLVIATGMSEQQTYWALSKHQVLGAAREDLRKREGAMKVSAVHFAEKVKGEALSEARVERWLSHRGDVDAAVWTGLPPTLSSPLVENAVGYLSNLVDNDVIALAREYVTKAPPQIQTAVRAAMRERGWQDQELPRALFET